MATAAHLFCRSLSLKISSDLSWCPGWESNPHSRCREKDFKSFASACFATRAPGYHPVYRGLLLQDAASPACTSTGSAAATFCVAAAGAVGLTMSMLPLK